MLFSKKVKYIIFVVLSVGYCLTAAECFSFSPETLSSKLVGNLKLKGRGVSAVALSKHYAYIATRENRITYEHNNKGYRCKLEIVNIAEPTKPMLLGSLYLWTDLPPLAGSITIAGSYAYVTSGCAMGGKVSIVNIENPQKPFLVGNLKIGKCINKFTIDKDHAYGINSGMFIKEENEEKTGVSEIRYKQGKGLIIFDRNNPAVPALTTNLVLGGETHGLAISNGYEYIADKGGIDGEYGRRGDGVYENAGLKIVNVTNPKTPLLAGTLKTYRIGGGPIIVGNYAYITSFYTPSLEKSELRTVNISNPAKPFVVGNLEIEGFLSGLVIKGNYAYARSSGFGEKEDEIKIINIKNPANPIIVDSLKTKYCVNDIAVTKNNLYVANGEAGLKIFDIR